MSKSKILIVFSMEDQQDFKSLWVDRKACTHLCPVTVISTFTHLLLPIPLSLLHLNLITDRTHSFIDSIVDHIQWHYQLWNSQNVNCFHFVWFIIMFFFHRSGKDLMTRKGPNKYSAYFDYHHCFSYFIYNIKLRNKNKEVIIFCQLLYLLLRY